MSAKTKDLTGQRFGRLVALSPTSERKNRYVVWHCQCDCSAVVDVSSNSLLRGDTQSCGCLHSELSAQRARSRIGDKNPTFKNLAGMKFGRLLVISPTDERNVSGDVIWFCKCDCGATTKVSAAHLTSNNTRSCGCLQSEAASEALTKTNRSHAGDKSPKWIADRSLVVRQRNRAEMKQTSRKCFERDDFTCQYCNKRGGELHAHHLYNWADFPEKRFDLDNLITLCAECHHQFHKLFGVKNNSAAQFYEWLNKKIGDSVNASLVT